MGLWEKCFTDLDLLFDQQHDVYGILQNFKALKIFVSPT